MTASLRSLLVGAAIATAVAAWATTSRAGPDHRRELEWRIAHVDTLLAREDVTAADSVTAWLSAGWKRFGSDSLVWLDIETCRLRCMDAAGMLGMATNLADELIGVADRRGAPPFKRGELLGLNASILLRNRMLPEALEACERLFEALEGSIEDRDPARMAPSFMVLATGFREAEFPQGERRLLEKVCEYRENVGPGDAMSLEAKLYLGDLAAARGDWHDAIEQYRRVWSYGIRTWTTGDWRLKRAKRKLQALLFEHGGRREDDPEALPPEIKDPLRSGVGPTYSDALRKIAKAFRDSTDRDPEAWPLRRIYLLTSATNLERLAEECDRPSLSAAGILAILDARRRDSPSGWRGKASAIAYFQLFATAFIERDHEVADALCRQMFDANATDTAMVVYTRELAFEFAGTTALLRRDWRTAEADFQRALAVESSPGGRAEGLMAMSLVKLLRGDPAAGVSYALEADDLLHKEFERYLPELGFSQAVHESQGWRENLGLLLSCALAGATPGRAPAAWDRFMDCRGAISNEFAQQRHEAAARTRAASRRQALLTEQSALLVRSSRPGDTQARARLGVMGREIQALDEVLRSSRPAPDHRGCAELARAMPDSAAMLAFARVGLVDPDTSQTSLSPLFDTTHPRQQNYLACLIRRGRPVVLKDLGRADTIDSLAAAWRHALLAGSGESAPARVRRLTHLGRELRERLWEPWSQDMRGIRLLFCVPDGALQRLPLDCLPTSEEHFLVESGPAITYLTHERDLPASRAPTRGLGVGALIVGAPAFGDPGDTTTSASSQDLGTRGGEADCADFGKRPWRDLPGSRAEAEDVAARLHRPTHGERDTSGVMLLTGASATESAVKAACAGRRIVHLATHAFVFDRACSEPESSETPAQDPLLLAGVVLAGANREEATPEGSSDEGILTAGEVAELDLSAAEWAVLSGCDTGSGQSIGSECVLGLQRAFRIAGASTLIMSLWPVRDDMAGAWMRELYLQKFDAGRNTADAVREASRTLIRRMRQHHDFPDPRYWGAFIAAGNWR